MSGGLRLGVEMALTIAVEVEAASGPQLDVTAASVAGVWVSSSLSSAPEPADVAAGAAVVACPLAGAAGAAAAAVLAWLGAGRLRVMPTEPQIPCAKDSVAESRG